MAALKDMRVRLASESGASILLALAVVLVCSMVASVVLVAASTNSGKAVDAAQREQAYYAVASAAQLFADELAAEAPSAELSASRRSYACQQAHPSYYHDDAEALSALDLIFADTSGNPTPLMSLMEEALRDIDSANPNARFERSFALHAPDMEDVAVGFSMDANYDIRITLEAQGESGHSYAATLVAKAVQSEPIVSTKVEKTDAHWDGWEYKPEAQSLSWKETTVLNMSTGNYEPASNDYGASVEQLYEVTTTTTTVSLTWASASIEKGVE